MFKCSLILMGILFVSSCAQEYVIHGSHVIYHIRNEGGNMDQKMPKADAATFMILNHQYAKDAHHVYYRSHPIAGAELKSFHTLSEYVGVDSKHVYYDGKIIQHANPRSFKILDADWSRDNSHVFLEDDSINACDPHTFVIVNDWWEKDSKCYYFAYGARVRGIDYPTFRPLSETYASDKDHVYYHDSVLKGANPATFMVSAQLYASGRDKERCYDENHPIECTDWLNKVLWVHTEYKNH